MKLSEYDDEDIIAEVIHRGMNMETFFKVFKTKELVEELRKRDGVDFWHLEGDDVCPLHERRSNAYPAIILRITD